MQRRGMPSVAREASEGWRRGGIESASTCQNIRVFRGAVLHRVAPCGADWTPGSNEILGSRSGRTQPLLFVADDGLRWYRGPMTLRVYSVMRARESR